MNTKQCTRCLYTKPITEFTKRTASPSGYHSWCKQCAAAYSRLRWKDKTYRTRKENKRAQSKAWKIMTKKTNAARRARKKGQFVEHIDPQVVFDMHRGVCGICNKLIQDNFHVDHVIPLSKGGLHSYANTQPTHPHCNLVKYNRLPKE